MTKRPFTAAGFYDLQQQLYSLPDQELEIQALEILNNFTGWMEMNFELTPTQIHFLNHIHQKALSFTAYTTSFAVSNRLPVHLIKPQQKTANGPDNPQPDDGKIIRPKSKLWVSSDKDGLFQAGGTVDIDILYEKL